MSDLVQIVAIVVSSLLLVLVVELVRRKLLVEEYSFIWLIAAGSLLVLSVFRTILHALARWLGIYYPPSLLLLVLFLFVFVGMLYFSIVVSRQRAHINRLFEESALMWARLRDLQAQSAAQVTRQDPLP